MKLRKFKSNEHGAVAILVALSMTALFGFTALAVDYGMMASNKQSMQNACDAAALAGAVDLMNGRSGTVTATGYNYAAINGYDHNNDNVEVTVEQTGTTVKVTIREEMQMGFSGVLTGERTRTVSATATAETTSMFGNAPYAMFAEEIISINGNGTTINGDVHCNGDINISGTLVGDSIATAVGTATVTNGTKFSGSMSREMPTFAAFERAKASMNLVTLNKSYTLKKNEGGFQKLIDDALAAYHGTQQQLEEEGLCIYVNGSITANGNDSTVYEYDYPITLIVKGSIEYNGSVAASAERPLYLMSETGSITVNGGGAQLTGLVYAPNGNITLNGHQNPTVVNGSLVGEKIICNGGQVTVNYVHDIDHLLPNGKVHLVS
ncbi:MAG: hypothetical protein IKU58_04845 [Clostridia bacterium]|nr:hypothetical protein [Clostridia bacterium]